MSSLADKLSFGPKREFAEQPDGGVIVTVTPNRVFVPNATPQTLRLSADQNRRMKLWLDRDVPIQDALRDLTDNEREVLMSGLDNSSFDFD